MTILDELAEYARERVRQAKEKKSLEEVKAEALGLPVGNFEFEKALAGKEVSFICECKKASPSKGLIAPDFPYLKIAKEYEAAGADCISVLTEPKWFLGSDEYLREIAKAVSIPCIRKDFTVDEYMIYEAKVLGAKAVLLICAILTEDEIKRYLAICDELGISAIVEAHDEEEILMAVRANARIIGVNNRNLKDFSVNTENSKRLRKLVPDNVIFVSESGIKSREDIEKVTDMGANAVLIGETLMRASDKKAMLDELKGISAKALFPKQKEGPNGFKNTKIKLCGLKSLKDIEMVNELKPDYIGFVFWDKSHRNISEETASGMKQKLSKDIKAFGVFVDETVEKVAHLANTGIIDVIQLHGNEDEVYITELRKALKNANPIIKAFKVEGDNLKKAKESSADMLIFDPGKGDGMTFSWEVLKDFDRPFFLAGGLNSENVSLAIETLHPYAVDVSSSIETDKIKDKEKATAFVRAVRACNN